VSPIQTEIYIENNFCDLMINFFLLSARETAWVVLSGPLWKTYKYKDLKKGGGIQSNQIKTYVNEKKWR